MRAAPVYQPASHGVPMPRTAALIGAAGRGERVGGPVPKQYLPLLGKPMLRWTVEAFLDRVDAVQLVIGPDDEAAYREATYGLDLPHPVAGGATRQHSVMHGLEVLAHLKPDFVLIHDAARPLV